MRAHGESLMRLHDELAVIKSEHASGQDPDKACLGCTI